MWTTPFSFTNSWNSWLMNCGPLSVTILWGKPWTANIARNLLIVANVDVVAIGTTSNHLPCLTTHTRLSLGPSCKQCRSVPHAAPQVPLPGLALVSPPGTHTTDTHAECSTQSSIKHTAVGLLPLLLLASPCGRIAILVRVLGPVQSNC